MALRSLKNLNRLAWAFSFENLTPQFKVFPKVEVSKVFVFFLFLRGTINSSVGVFNPSKKNVLFQRNISLQMFCWHEKCSNKSLSTVWRRLKTYKTLFEIIRFPMCLVLYFRAYLVLSQACEKISQRLIFPLCVCIGDNLALIYWSMFNLVRTLTDIGPSFQC